jgi:DNA-damage-inducible protein J
MSNNAVIRARISDEIMHQASAVLAGMGLTVSDIMRITLTRVAMDGRLPFELTPDPPNSTTLVESEHGAVPLNAAEIEELFRQLRI